MKKGIDVSNNQGNIDWQKVKDSGIEFVMIRMGWGDDLPSQDDPKFEEYVKGCEAVGLPWGAYLYSYALGMNEAESELKHCLRLLAGKKPLYPIAFDMEDSDQYKAKKGMPSNEMLVKICERVLSGLEEAGYYSSLYASRSWLENQLKDSRLDRFDKWVAEWTTELTYSGEKGMWQYGGSTNLLEEPYVNGIEGKVDKDFAFYDFPAIMRENGLNGWEKPAPEPVEPVPETPVEPVPETPVEPVPETPAEPVPETPTEPIPVDPPKEPSGETPPANQNNSSDNNETGKTSIWTKILEVILEFLKKLFKWI